MQDLASERGLTPHFGAEGEPSVARPGGHEAAREAVPALRQFDEAKRLLDGLGGLGWIAVGFLLGAVFWHFVGFWGFVSDVVLAGRPPSLTEPALARMLPVQDRGSWVQTAEVVAAPQACIALRLDRATGRTSAVACDARSEAAFATDAFEGREDRAPATHGGGSGVVPYSPPHAPGAD